MFRMNLDDWRKVFLFLLLWSMINVPPKAYGQRFLFTHYRLNENLYEANSEVVSGYVKVICQAKNRLLYIGTKFGFCVYDGNKFRNYTRYKNNYIGAVNDFAELDDGRIAVLSNTQGILVLDQNSLTAIPVVPVTPAARFISFHRTPRGDLLVSSTNGVFRFRKDHFAKTPVSGDNKNCFYFDLENINDSLLLASNAPGAPFTVFDSSYRPVKHYELPEVVYDVQDDKKGNLWMATPAGLKRASADALIHGSMRFDPVPASLTKAGIDGKIVISLYADPYANLWVGTAFGGLFKVDSLYNVTQFHFRNGFNFDRVNCFFEDAEHNLWLGTENGLIKIPDPRIVKYISDDGLQSSTIHHLYSFQGDLLGISTNNFFKVNQQDHQKIVLIDTLPEAIGMFSHGSSLYVYSSTKLFRATRVHQRYHLEQTGVVAPPGSYFKRGALALPDGRLLLPLSTGGIFSVNGSRRDRVPGINYVADNIHYDSTHQLLWISELREGLHIYRTDERFDLLRNDSSLSRNVSAVADGSGDSLWIATRDKGLFQAKWDGKQLHVLQHITTGQGLSSDLCTSVICDANGFLFAGNTASLDVVQKINGQFVINSLAAQLGYYNEIYTLARDDHGNTWAGGLSGLLMLPAYANLLSIEQTQTFITRIELTDSIIADPSGAVRSGLVLKPYQNDISFEFASPYLKSESMVRYVYRLLRKGDTSWSLPFTNTSLALKDLPPGSFTFEVKAIFPDGSASQDVASVTFRILSPWYRSWWFMLLCISILAGLLYALYRYRLRQVIRLQQVRNRIASDLHDDIGSTLTNINILSSLGRRSLGEPAQAKEFLDRITEEVNSSSQALDDIIWSVNTRHDGLDETVARMRRYAAELFDAGNVHYEFELDPALAQKRLSMEQRRDIYLVFKELLNNIFKHAEAKKVRISIYSEHGRLVLSVQDDGAGFDPLAETSRNGLKNLRARVGRWDGQLQIRSSPGKGTLTVAGFPING